LFNKYVQGNLDSIFSSFNVKDIETWIIRLLAQIERIRKTDVFVLLANTYGGYLANKENPKWRAEMEEHLGKLLERMISLNLVEQEGDYIQLTLLGRACGRSSLSFESTLRLVEFLNEIQPGNLTSEQLMCLVQALPELDSTYTPLMKKGQKETIRQREAIERFNLETVKILQRFAPQEFSYYARCKRAAIVYDWIRGIPIEEIEQQYSTTPYQGKISYGDIRKFADVTRFYLRSAYQIVNVMYLGAGPNEESIESLLKQLEVGIPAEALPLIEIPVPLERGEYLALYNANIKVPEDIQQLQKKLLKRYWDQ